MACPDCDLLNRFPGSGTHATILCARCGAVLFRHRPNSIEHSLALTLAALILFVLSNRFPFLSMQSAGLVQEIIQLSGIYALWGQGLHGLSILLLLTGILVPVVQMGGLFYILAPLHWGNRPARHGARVFRLVQEIAPWGMIEIFMVGILVALVKLGRMATIVPGEVAEENARFHLYADRDSIEEKQYTIRNYYALLVDESVRGLSIGAPVELDGIKLGEVVDLKLEFDLGQNKFFVPVIVAIEPERVRILRNNQPVRIDNADHAALLKYLVEQQGLRAQLQSGNLLTGQLMVNMVFVDDAPKLQATLSELQKTLVEVQQGGRKGFAAELLRYKGHEGTASNPGVDPGVGANP
nr:paraquat-inducible protein A [uncultured Desulfobulbus sp.]